MTAFTARAELAVMSVIGAVTVNACRTDRICERIGEMTGFALRLTTVREACVDCRRNDHLEPWPDTEIGARGQTFCSSIME